MRCLLRNRRLSQGLSQRQLEVISGVDRSRISAYENNKVVMSIDVAAQFAIILHCSLDDLYDYRRA
ncbi:helix-turn-helix domain-containing protein [Sporosarcina psychrophila]|uniref:helix-turn-helix domain-containing protein n=1 Tax=Sporosarcina psychrophila TaxID=1476 RepID=UPI003393264F